MTIIQFSHYTETAGLIIAQTIFPYTPLSYVCFERKIETYNSWKGPRRACHACLKLRSATSGFDARENRHGKPGNHLHDENPALNIKSKILQNVNNGNSGPLLLGTNCSVRAYGVVVSMFDFHRSDRGSNPGCVIEWRTHTCLISSLENPYMSN